MDAYACDLSDSGTLRIVGADAALFIRTMFSGDTAECEEIGSLAQGLLLNSAGEVIDLVMVLRTGDSEFMMLCSSENVEEAFEWLSAHAELEDNDGPVFPDLTVEDHSEDLAVLIMYGLAAGKPFSDLCRACQDGYPLITYAFKKEGYGIPYLPAYLIFVPMTLASQVGDFLLDYPELEVIDAEEFNRLLVEKGRYVEALAHADYVKPEEVGLEGYLREERDFVGAKALDEGL